MANLKLSEDRDRRGRSSQSLVAAALVLALVWVLLCLSVFWGATSPAGPLTWILRIVGMALPVALIAFAAGLAMQYRALQGELSSVQDDLDSLRIRRERMARDPEIARPGPPAPERRQAIPEPTPEFSSRRDPRPAPPQFASRRDTPPQQDKQASLPLDAASQSAPPPLSVADLIRALHFPETPTDRDGFRALNRALKDHRAAQVVAAAQDMLTLLSQDGVYMDDLPPDRARPEMWRRFAQDERDASLGALGGIRDTDALAICNARLRDNTVFRDAAHHFLRRFDRMLADIEPQMSDEDIVQLTDTRSARAFMLVGRAAGIFDRG